MLPQKNKLITFLPTNPEGGKTLSSQNYSGEVFEILNLIDYNIEYLLKSSDTNSLTNEQRHNILQILFAGKDIELRNLTDKEKIKIIEKLFVGDTERLKDLSDEEKLGIFQELLNFNKKSETLKDEEKYKILYDLFNGKEIDSSFLYKGKGAELYENISKDESYPFIDIENEALENLRYNDKFLKILNNTKYITDVGCGDGQKVISLLGPGGPNKDRHFVLWDGTYIPEDYSGPMLDIAVENIKKGLPHVNIGSSQKLNSGSHLSQDLSDNMYLFLGGTICNMTDDEIISELKNMDNHGFLEGNHILLSYFTAPNTEDEIKKLIAIYNSDNNKAFHENGMDILGLSRNDFEFDTVYEKENPNQTEGPFPGRIKGVIRVKRDNTVKLSNGKEISVKKGQEFTIHYSRRFTKQGIEKLFKKSGCNCVFTIDKDGDSIVLLKKKPTQIRNFVNKHKTALLVALSLSSMVAGGVVNGVINTKIQSKNAKEQAKLDLHANRLAHKNISTYETTYYKQETDELINALQLNDLNKKDRETIIELFNIYVGEHKTNGMNNKTLIRDFWTSRGEILINRFNLEHYPYDFMNNEIIYNTRMINGDLSCKLIMHATNLPSRIIGGNYGTFDASIEIHSGGKRVLEYQDGGKTYLILTVTINTKDGKKEIYMVADGDEKTVAYPEYSTYNLNKIKDKSGLNSNIISNTKNLGGDFIFKQNVDQLGIEHKTNYDALKVINKDSDQIIDGTKFGGRDIKTYGIFINGKLYHVILAYTESGKQIGLASETQDGEYSTATFNEIAPWFLSEYNAQGNIVAGNFG